MNHALVKEPIYQQLNQLLRLLITSGEVSVGSKFLTERQICQRFQVSRATANKALSNLVSEGLLEFRKGIGTFVRTPGMDYNLRALVSFTDEAIAAGKRPGTRALRFESISAREAPAEAVSALNAAANDALYYMERLRLADDLPVIFERRHVVAAHCPDLTEADTGGSLYALWTDKYNLVIEGANQSIRAVNVRGPEAKTLDVRDGAAGLLVTSVGYLSGRQPLWFERTLYRGDAYEFRNLLGGIQAAGQAVGNFL